MSPKHEPYADVCEDGYRIVRHTHDVEMARELLRIAELKAYGCPGGRKFEMCEDLRNPDCPHLTIRGAGRQVYVRIIQVFADNPLSDDFAYLYKECNRSRGAFPAVVFS